MEGADATDLDDAPHGWVDDPEPSTTAWRVLAAVGVVASAAAILVDRVVPTFVILGIAAVSLAARRSSPATLGFHRVERPWRMALEVLGWTVLWTAVLLAVVMPVLEHLTGQLQDVSDFEQVKGDPAVLAVLLALSWTVAALGEETAYRGYLLTRTREVLGAGRLPLVVAVLASALLFGFAHTEQGAIGVALTFLDAVVFSVLRLRYRTLWASVLAHGFNNTIGLVAFFLVGPLHGLW